jgi:hypothetical protein
MFNLFLDSVGLVTAVLSICMGVKIILSSDKKAYRHAIIVFLSFVIASISLYEGALWPYIIMTVVILINLVALSTFTKN